MAQYRDIKSLRQSVESQASNLNRLDEEISRLKSADTDSNNISQKENKLKNDTIRYNSIMDILNNYNSLIEGVKEIKELEDKKNDSLDYIRCFNYDTKIIELKNELEPLYLSLCNNIQDLQNNEEIKNAITGLPKIVKGNKVDSSNGKDLDFPGLRKVLNESIDNHAKLLDKLNSDLKKYEKGYGQHSTEYMQCKSNIEAEKNYIRDKETMVKALQKHEEIPMDALYKALDQENEKLERYKKDLKELSKEDDKKFRKLYEDQIAIIEGNIDRLADEITDAKNYNDAIKNGKNIDIKKSKASKEVDIHMYERQKFLNDREINVLAQKLSAYDYTASIIIGSSRKAVMPEKTQVVNETNNTKTVNNTENIEDLKAYYEELLKEGNLVGPQKFPGNGYASELNAVKNALAANGVVVESTKVSNDNELEEMKEYYQKLISEGHIIGPLKFPGNGYASELKGVKDYLISHGVDLSNDLNNQTIPVTPEKTSVTNENSKLSSSDETTEPIEDMSDEEFDEMMDNLFRFDDYDEPETIEEETELAKGTAEEPETIEEEPEEEFEEVIETKPCSWIKAHKKQILIGAGITALSIATVLLIAQVLPAVIAALKTKSILTITNQMMANGAQWKLSSAAQKAVLHSANEALAAGLKGSLFNPTSGIWTIAGTNLTDFAGAAALKHAAALSKLSVLVPGVSITSLLGSAAIYTGKKLDKDRSPIYTAIDKVISDMKKEEIDSLAEIDVKSEAIKKQIDTNTEMTKEEKERLTYKLNKVTKKKKAKLEKKSKGIDKGKEQPNKTKDPLLELETIGINIDGLTEEDKKEIRDIMNEKSRELSEFTDEEIEELKEIVDKLKGVSK